MSGSCELGINRWSAPARGHLHTELISDSNATFAEREGQKERDGEAQIDARPVCYPELEERKRRQKEKHDSGASFESA